MAQRRLYRLFDIVIEYPAADILMAEGLHSAHAVNGFFGSGADICDAFLAGF